MTENKAKVAIIGAGPSGGILGAFIAQKGIEVILVDIWKEHINAIAENGLQIIGKVNLTIKFDKNNLKTSISELKNSGVNLVFIATKTPYLREVVQSLKEVISKETLVISHQNGLNTEQVLVEAFGEERSFRNVINYAGNIIKPGKINMTFFNPPNYCGAVSSVSTKKAHTIVDVMNSPQFETVFSDHWQKDVWKKVILNSSLSPVCAITGQTMKEAMDFNATRTIASEIIKEGIAVTKAIGINFEPDFHNICLSYLSKGGNHKPSMLIDIENRSPTEIDYLNGKIVEIGKKNNISVPFNESTANYVRALESQYRKR